MTDTIREQFAKKGKLFIPFITCGDPDLETTAALVRCMAEAGADIIELGIPFSDPTAEGPVIQEASLRALEGGTTTDKIFAMVKDLRADCDVPLVFMTYANVVYHYGIERFCEHCREIGVTGLILPDVPLEERGEFTAVCDGYGVSVIPLIAPTSHDRIRAIASDARGFVYCVSSLGVTGVRSNITTDVGAMVKAVKEADPTLPAAIGFGISTPEQAASMAAVADGVIVGSAIVRIIGKYGRESIGPVRDYVRSMVEAIR